MEKRKNILNAIKETRIHLCKDFETMLMPHDDILRAVIDKDHLVYDKHSCFENGRDKVEFDLIKSEHGWGYSSIYNVKINGVPLGIIGIDDLREIQKERYN